MINVERFDKLKKLFDVDIINNVICYVFVLLLTVFASVGFVFLKAEESGGTKYLIAMVAVALILIAWHFLMRMDLLFIAGGTIALFGFFSYKHPVLAQAFPVSAQVMVNLVCVVLTGQLIISYLEGKDKKKKVVKNE